MRPYLSGNSGTEPSIEPTSAKKIVKRVMRPLAFRSRWSAYRSTMLRSSSAIAARGSIGDFGAVLEDRRGVLRARVRAPGVRVPDRLNEALATSHLPPNSCGNHEGAQLSHSGA